MLHPPLSREELIAIRDGNRRNADVRALLHEIRRLRVVATYARDYIQCVDTHAQHTESVRDILLEYINADPAMRD